MTKRPISLGAENMIRRHFDVLDYGFVYLVDYMGDDLAIEEAARVSYGPGMKRATDTTGLIRYLKRNEHTSPYEMVELKFHIKMPIFVARQWVRHRTASLNEISARYSVLEDEFYIPEPGKFSYQSTNNKQGRGETLSIDDSQLFIDYLSDNLKNDYDLYKKMLQAGVARELARTTLPVSIYTEMYWKIDLHNLMHFLKLRLDSHAQYEIREYAGAIANIVKEGWPISFKSFDDYVLQKVSFSGPEVSALRSALSLGVPDSMLYSTSLGKSLLDSVRDLISVEDFDLSDTEKREFLEKIERIING